MKELFKGLFGKPTNEPTPTPVVPVAPITPPLPEMSLLQKFDIATLFDVGANSGQYAGKIRAGGYSGRLVSFEPLSEAHDSLSKAAKDDHEWIVHPRSAIGDQAGSTTINVSGNSFSSSIFPMLEAHASAAPESQYVGTEEVKVIKLDDVFGDYAAPDGRNFLKIDTQGFEKQVLEGATDVLGDIAAIRIELSIVPLYEGGETFEFFVAWFKAKGFALWDIERGFCDPRTGRMLQFDGIFVNEDRL